MLPRISYVTVFIYFVIRVSTTLERAKTHFPFVVGYLLTFYRTYKVLINTRPKPMAVSTYQPMGNQPRSFQILQPEVVNSPVVLFI